MAIKINGMKMPTECYGCRFLDFDSDAIRDKHDNVWFLDASCHALDDRIGHDIDKERPDWSGYHYAIQKGERWEECPLEEFK